MVKLGSLVSNLRNVFKKGKGSKPEDGSDSSVKPAEGGSKGFVIPASINNFSFQKINLRTVNQVLSIILVSLFILLGYVISQEQPEVSSLTASVSKIKLMEVDVKPANAFGDIAIYLDQITKRDVFSIFKEEKEPVKVVEPVKVEPPPPPSPKVPIEEKARGLKLIGISWGENPKAIIRDESSQDMYFVREKEVIQGTELKIEKILKNEVVITSDGDEMSML